MSAYHGRLIFTGDDQTGKRMSELNFKGKEFVFNHHLAVPHRPLVPDPAKSIGAARLDGNLVIHGDNLHALKSLLPMYAGKVDCIFIDPPYNTGNEGWGYNDNVNSPMMQEWLRANPIGIEDGLRHDKWCAMMWPRLRLLRELLSDTGSIWITLDHHEAHRARQMLDELFGERNFLAHMAWQKVYSPRMDAKGFSTDFDQVLVYAKSKAEVFLATQVSEQNSKQFTYVEPETGKKARLRTLRKEGSESLRSDRENCWYPIEAPDGTQIWPIRPDGREGRWRWEETTFLAEKAAPIPKFIFVQGEGGSWEVQVKQYFKGATDRPISTLLTHEEYGHTHMASEEIKRIFGDSVFDTPKPVKLIAQILDLACPSDGIVLDSFAGSGTTGHAVLLGNKDDEVERRFVLVECEDYADHLTAERIRRVMNGYSFVGNHRTELLKKSLTFTDLKKADKLLSDIAAIENLEGHLYDKVEKKVKDGVLSVEGVKQIAEHMEGLGGEFTYCTLGAAIDLDQMLTGEALPTFDQLGALLFHMATSEAIDQSAIAVNESTGVGYLGESAQYHVWLIYKPELDFLKSREAALTMAKAQALTAAKPGKKQLVFAPAKFVSQKLLGEAGLQVEFAPLPWALYRAERG